MRLHKVSAIGMKPPEFERRFCAYPPTFGCAAGLCLLLSPGGENDKTELLYLTWVTVLSRLLWVPYILHRAAVWGLTDTVDSGQPETGFALGKTAH